MSSKTSAFQNIRKHMDSGGPIFQEKKGKKEPSLFETMCLLLLLSTLQASKSERELLAQASA